MYCPRCKAQVPDNSSFCNSCGLSLKANNQQRHINPTPPQQYRQVQPLQNKHGLSPILIIGIIFFSCCFALIAFLGGKEDNKKTNSTTIAESTTKQQPRQETTTKQTEYIATYKITGRELGDYGRSITLNESTDGPEVVFLHKIPAGT